MKELKDRFITAWLYGGWLFKVLLLIVVGTFIFSMSYLDPVHPYPAWISTIVYIFSGTGVILFLYPESW